MNREPIHLLVLQNRVPRVYGDEPQNADDDELDDVCSPCIRGWIAVINDLVFDVWVFPADQN